MKTSITPSELHDHILNAFGDFDIESRNKADLRDILNIGHEIRIGGSFCRTSSHMITKIGKRSFSTSHLANPAIKHDFIINTSGQILEKGESKKNSRLRLDVYFDCEKIDINEAKIRLNEEKAASAIELSRAILLEITNITPYAKASPIDDDTLMKLKCIKAILDA